MGDEPPPLPPKLKNYSEEDKKRALEEEKRAFEKLERSHSQRAVKNKDKVILSQPRPQTPQERKSQFYDVNYTAKPVARPIPKPRNISLYSPLPSELDSNKNIKPINNKELNLMSFVSPEKPKNNYDDLIDRLNINKSSYLPSQPAAEFSRSPLSSSKSMPYMTSYTGNNSSLILNAAGNNWQGNSASGTNNFLESCWSNLNPLHNVQQFYPVNTFNIAGNFNVLPNIPLVQNVDTTPPLPNRNPILDINRLSNAMKQGMIGSTPSKIFIPPPRQSTDIQVKATIRSQPPDLIDLGSSSSNNINCSTNNSTKDSLFSSLLADFDPLTVKSRNESNVMNSPVSTNDVITLSKEAQELLNYKSSRNLKDDEQSYYEQVDPFEYMQPSAASTRSDPVIDIYDGLGSPGAIGGDTFDIPPPLPPRTGKGSPEVSLRSSRRSRRRSNVKDKKRSVTVLEGKVTNGHIQLQKMPALNADEEAISFWEKIKNLRAEYVYHDHIGNSGLLISPCQEYSNITNLSVKLTVYYEKCDPARFTCNLNTSVEHVVMQSMEIIKLTGNCTDYLLKVRGIDEYLCGESQLGDYDYVHICIKNDKDIDFTLSLLSKIKKSYLRTGEDDLTVEKSDARSLLRTGSTDATYYESLEIAVEAFEKEIEKLQESGFQLLAGTPVHELKSPMRSRQVRQVVKQICSLLGELETCEVSKYVDFLIDTCRIIQKSQGVLDGEDDIPGQKGMLSTGSHDSSLPPEEFRHRLMDALSRLTGSINNFLYMYTRAFRVDFTIDKLVDASEDLQEISSVREVVKVQVFGLHRLDKDWHFDEFFIEAQLYHGTLCVGRSSHTSSCKVLSDPKFYPKVTFEQSVDMGFRVNTIPRESRLVFTVFGIKRIPSENKPDLPHFIRQELGWAAIQMFSFDGFLTSGGFLLTLWPIVSDKRLGPAPCSSDHPHAHTCPILSVELMDYGYDVFFPPIKPLSPNQLNFEDLDVNAQQQLADIIERDIFTFNKSITEEREILWEKRHYLYQEPEALAKVLLAAHSWDVMMLPDLHSLVLNWKPLSPSDALHLLLPCFPDTVVRNKAVEWIRGLLSDELIAYLPQLVQAVKHEAWDVSNLTELLLERALTSPRLAHHLYWLLNQCLPQQTSMGGEQEVLVDARYTRRLNMVTRALMIICGKNLENRLLRQEGVLRTLYETALAIKDAKDSHRKNILQYELKNIHQNLKECPTSLPLSPSHEVAGVDIEACNYYTSFTVPLRLAFISSEPNTQSIHTIFKVGDDLRQDMLVIQMIRLMDKLWLKEKLDLKIITFNVVPTGDRIGILEMVCNAETLRKIQTENGLTGCFEERPIAEWLAKQNPSQLEYHRAVTNFTASCAGYCVATYILGICDRHNDNIMLKTSGHLFHIDFGKFLGDAQKFGNIKRDRTPFVLTADMAYVINGGEKPSDRFQSFVDMCCQAFNIIRKNAHLLLYLFALMASSGIPGVTYDAVHYVERALLQDRTNAEAGAFFAQMIQESLKSWSTQVNFFIHNLAQLRFTGENPECDTLLSFVPHTYTMAQDGKIRRVRLYSFQKRYNPNKYYVYILKVEREEQREPSYLFRSYKEFSEFHQKLCCTFPLAKIDSLPKGVQMGRSEVKAVADKRKTDIELFMASLFCLADEIAHSDLVYTFFHPLLRDQEDTDIHIKKLKKIKENRISTNTSMRHSSAPKLLGQVKVSLQYIRGQLQIIVQHARHLSKEPGSPEPSPYVKLYLLPDPHKRTKRKTKVVKKSCHPTFMEMITYRMSLDIIRQKVLEVSIWSEDKFSENVYLGSACLRLADLDFKLETCEWLSLQYNIRTAREHSLISTHS